MSFWFAILFVLNNSVTLLLAVLLVATWVLAIISRAQRLVLRIVRGLDGRG
jgi:hypothetical protein